MLYYPLMNYSRLVLLVFLPIGLGYDVEYLCFGGPILGHLLMMMIEVSSPGYTRRKDRILAPLNNFLIMLMILCNLQTIQASFQ